MRTALAALLALFATVSTAAAQAAVSVSKLLSDGYEVKAAFADGTGGAYMILQRGSSAFLCHSAPRQTCEKMN